MEIGGHPNDHRSQRGTLPGSGLSTLCPAYGNEPEMWAPPTGLPFVIPVSETACDTHPLLANACSIVQVRPTWQPIPLYFQLVGG